MCSVYIHSQNAASLPVMKAFSQAECQAGHLCMWDPELDFTLHSAAFPPLVETVHRQNAKLDIFACRALNQTCFPRSVLHQLLQKLLFL